MDTLREPFIILDPFTITAQINDASGILVATCDYTVNNGAPNSLPMTDMGNGDFTVSLPAVNDGDTICYTITAIDNSGCFNSETFPNNGTCVSFVASQGITFLTVIILITRIYGQKP